MRLIDKEEILNIFLKWRKTDIELHGKELEWEPSFVLRAVNEAPEVDAVPVVRGEWIRMDETQALLSVEWKCSQCGQEIRVDGILTAIGAGWKYCPNCGAKM